MPPTCVLSSDRGQLYFWGHYHKGCRLRSAPLPTIWSISFGTRWTRGRLTTLSSLECRLPLFLPSPLPHHRTNAHPPLSQPDSKPAFTTHTSGAIRRDSVALCTATWYIPSLTDKLSTIVHVVPLFARMIQLQFTAINRVCCGTTLCHPIEPCVGILEWLLLLLCNHCIHT